MLPGSKEVMLQTNALQDSRMLYSNGRCSRHFLRTCSILTHVVVYHMLNSTVNYNILVTGQLDFHVLQGSKRKIVDYFQFICKVVNYSPGIKILTT